MTAKWLTLGLVPLLAGCGYAYGQGVGVYEDGRYTYDDGYDRHAYEYDGRRSGRQSFRRLPVPRGHLPPRGACRVWLPGVPPGHQPPPGSCARLRHRVPAGAWLLWRPRVDGRVVELHAYDARRLGVRYRYVFDARNGRRIQIRDRYRVHDGRYDDRRRRDRRDRRRGEE